jgi:hypothetical protein
MKLVSALLLTAALAAPARADAVDFDKFLAWFDGLANTVVADQNDCTKLATDVNKSIDDNKATVDAAQKAHEQGKQLNPDQRNRLMAVGKKIGQAVAVKCAQDKGVQAAIERLPGPHRK